MSKLTLDEVIKHCLEVANSKEIETDYVGYSITDVNFSKIVNGSPLTNNLLMKKEREECKECAADHRQLAEWLMEYKDLKAEQNEQYVFIHELMSELKEAKRLLKAAVEDFAKLDRVNTKVRNCMMPDMDCADCPLSWDSVDDSVEPCHNWRYTDEALKLIGDESNGI